MPNWTLEDASHKMRLLSEVTIRHDSVFGNLYSLQAPDHPEFKDKATTYWRARFPRSNMYIHLNTNKVVVSDSVAMPLSNVTEAKIHKKNWAAMIFLDLLIFLGFVAISS
jgi:hypothetical protein